MQSSPAASRTHLPSLVDPSPDVGASLLAAQAEEARWLAPAAVVAAIAVGRALQIANGAFDPTALAWIALAFALLVVAAVVGRPKRFAAIDAWIVPALALGGLVTHIAQLITSLPGSFLRLGSGSLLSFHWGVAALAVIGASLIRGGPSRAMRWQVWALVATHAAIGMWLIQHAPSPAIDVHIFQRDALAALRSGVDPYGLTFPNIYSDSVFYGPGLAVGGRLLFGFPYPPMSLLAALPGQLLGGDHRYSQLIAMELAALLMAFTRPGGFGPLAATLYLTTPRVFFVLEQSWTEPFVVLGLAAVVFAACRHSRAMPWLFGAFIALKQYLVFALPCALLLLRWPFDRRQLLNLFGKAAIVAAAVTLPFFLWSPRGFWHSVVALQLYQPFRPEALSFLAWWASRGHGQLSASIAFVAAGLACLVAVRRMPRTPAGFAAAIALTFFAFFAFNKQAFCNYYFFVVGALCTTAAAWRPPAAAR